MHFAFLNPQGNFDPDDSYWTEHPDFGGQLVYVKQVALALGALGHRVDIVTRRIDDPDWPEFEAPLDAYPDAPNVRIVRIDAGPEGFLAKEKLWPFLTADWVPRIIEFYDREGRWPDVATGHYGDGGLAAALLRRSRDLPYTFTGHSLGAQKLDKLVTDGQSLESLDERYRFGRRLVAERIAMNHAGVVITSTSQERLEQYAHPAYRGAVDTADEDRFSLVPPGVNLEIFDAGASAADEDSSAAAAAHALASLPDHRRDLPVVVASSRLDPKKNHAVLVEALAASPALRDRVNLLILTGALEDPLAHPERVGGSERDVIDRLRSLIAAAHLGDSVATLSVQGQARLAATYRYLASRRSVFALTAMYEPFGLAPLEAAAAGLPVVVTRNGGPAESLRDAAGEYGVLVDPSDPQSVAAGILRALDEWDHFAAAGRGRVYDRYTWDRTAGGYVAAAERAAAVGRRRNLLPIHPYFQVSAEETDVGLDELGALYAPARMRA